MKWRGTWFWFALSWSSSYCLPPLLDISAQTIFLIRSTRKLRICHNGDVWKFYNRILQRWKLFFSLVIYFETRQSLLFAYKNNLFRTWMISTCLFLNVFLMWLSIFFLILSYKNNGLYFLGLNTDKSAGNSP